MRMTCTPRWTSWPPAKNTSRTRCGPRQLASGTRVLYGVSSAAFEGGPAHWALSGTPKDGVRGRLQIVYGLLTSKAGVPVALEVFSSNTGDPTTVADQVRKLKDRFGLARVVLV